MTLTPEEFEAPIARQLQEMLDAIETICSEKNCPEVDKILEALVDGRKTFCPAEFLEQDPLNPEHRFVDLVGGTPFTSDSYPWPVTEGSGLHMQPLVQLNLEEASRRLGSNLGSGLLQVWGHVYKTADELSEHMDEPFLVRIVPTEALAEPLNSFAPDFQPWTLSDDDSELFTAGCLMKPVDDEEFKTMPRLKWLSPRPMFGGFHHIFGVLSTSESKALGGDDEYANLAEEMASQLDFSEISIGWHSVYLGGLGGQAGGPEDPTFNNDLLIRVCDGNGFHLGICLSHDRQGRTVFTPAFRIQS